MALVVAGIRTGILVLTPEIPTDDVISLAVAVIVDAVEIFGIKHAVPVDVFPLVDPHDPVQI
ncbi:MAG: hypothetical protein P8181_16605, partial [bacterium]